LVKSDSFYSLSRAICKSEQFGDYPELKSVRNSDIFIPFGTLPNPDKNQLFSKCCNGLILQIWHGACYKLSQWGF
jgi:hypothetical protein